MRVSDQVIVWQQIDYHSNRIPGNQKTQNGISARFLDQLITKCICEKYINTN